VLTYPEQFGKDCLTAALPDGDLVIFYQMIPLYAEELAFKEQCEDSMEEFEKYLGDVIENPLDAKRPSCVPKGYVMRKILHSAEKLYKINYSTREAIFSERKDASKLRKNSISFLLIFETKSA